MRVQINRTRMAMVGRFYAYDAYVSVHDAPAEIVKQATHFYLLNGEKFLTATEATLPIEHFARPKGYNRYADYLDHQARTYAAILEHATSVYPELHQVEKWPTCFVELAGIDASHDSRAVNYEGY